MQNAQLSKRQQQKIDKRIKSMQQNQKKQQKHKKRRAHTTSHNIACQARKVRRQYLDSQESNRGEQSQQEEDHQDKKKVLPNHLNAQYAKLEDKDYLANYLQGYYQNINSKTSQKNQKDMQKIHESNTQIQVSKNALSLQFCNRIDKKFKEAKDKLRDPLSRAHRQFYAKVLNNIQ